MKTNGKVMWSLVPAMVWRVQSPSNYYAMVPRRNRRHQSRSSQQNYQITGEARTRVSTHIVNVADLA